MKQQQLAYTFTTPWNRMQGAVIVTIYQIQAAEYMPASTLVVITEPYDNPGQSVTNACEVIVSKLVADFGLDPELTRWVEHYPPRRHPTKPHIVGRDEDFDAIDFTWHGATASAPEWRRLSRQWVEALIGEPFVAPVSLQEATV